MTDIPGPPPPPLEPLRLGAMPDTARSRGPRWRKWVVLLALFALVSGVSLLGSAFTAPQIGGWYAALEKPSFNPPPWVFAPAWRVWLAPASTARSVALVWFFVQLLLNAVWSPVFFGMESPGLALAVIVALLAALAGTVRAFFPVDGIAGWMLVPYLAWVCFAAVLNGAIVALN
jgi:translocator protein